MSVGVKAFTVNTRIEQSFFSCELTIKYVFKYSRQLLKLRIGDYCIYRFSSFSDLLVPEASGIQWRCKITFTAKNQDMVL